MTWYYSGDPTTSAKDAVRFWTGDTTEATALLQDEEIDYALTLQPSIKLCAADCLEAIAAKLLQDVDFEVRGELRMDLGQRAARYQARAQQLRKDAQRLGATPFAGGISVADKAARVADADRVAPAFARGTMDNGSIASEEETC